MGDASIKAFLPYLFLMFISAPLSINTLTTSILSLSDAKIKAVLPSLSLALMSISLVPWVNFQSSQDDSKLTHCN